MLSKDRATEVRIPPVQRKSGSISAFHSIPQSHVVNTEVLSSICLQAEAGREIMR